MRLGKSPEWRMQRIMSADGEQDVYENHVMRHYEEPSHRGRLADATHRCRLDNPVCGDSVQVELKVNATGIIEQAWFTAAGCIISQAAASMLTQQVEGQPIDAVRSFTARDMLNLFRAQLTPRRRQCCLLPWQALMTAIEPHNDRSFSFSETTT
jgi:nitrogen fixation NifU-like protein